MLCLPAQSEHVENAEDSKYHQGHAADGAADDCSDVRIRGTSVGPVCDPNDRSTVPRYTEYSDEEVNINVD